MNRTLRSLFSPVCALSAGLALSVLFSGCSAPGTRTVRVEDRSIDTRPAPAVRPAPAGATPAAAPPGSASVEPSVSSPASNAGKPGYYTVRPGDTLVKIGLDHGQSWRDIARWNQIDNPNLIEVGQVLRVRPESTLSREPRPSRSPASGVAVAPGTPPGPIATAPSAGSGAEASAPSTTPVASPAAPAGPTQPSAAPVGELVWSWPAGGPVLQGFDEQRNKGVDIGGRAGDPVLAAADGRVAYAGSALRGYGNLVILQHNGAFLSAYAHNQTLLVKEDQIVKRGQKIAEMGNTDAERVQLHFEIRRDGKPVDPARYLPAR